MNLNILTLYFCLFVNCDAFSPSRYTLPSSTICSSYLPSKSTSLHFSSPKYLQQYTGTRHVSQLKQYKENQDDSSLSDEIRELILSLSLETDDETRRGKISSLLSERLLNQDNVKDSAKFAHLWDVNVIQIGGEIQNEARLEAEQKQSSDALLSVEDEEREKANDENVVDDDADTKIDTRRKKEKQLWSMVDMMIQSKSVIKKLMEAEKFQ